MQSPCALYVPHYTVQALRARGKRAVSRLTSRFRVASYCRRVDLVCDYHGIGGGDKRCGDNDAQPDASASATSTATTTMHSPAAFHTAGVSAAYATFERSSTRTTQAKRACCRLVLALCVSCTPLYYPGTTRGDRGLRYARTIVNAHYVS